MRPGGHPRMVGLIKRWLGRAGYHVTGVTTVPEALEVLTAHPMEWVLTDLMMPTGDGMDIMAYARAHQPEAKVIIIPFFALLVAMMLPPSFLRG